jgi:hypothetical protein
MVFGQSPEGDAEGVGGDSVLGEQAAGTIVISDPTSVTLRNGD